MKLQEFNSIIHFFVEFLTWQVASLVFLQDCGMRSVSSLICDLGKYLVIFMAHLVKSRGKIEIEKSRENCTVPSSLPSTTRQRGLAGSGPISRASKWLPPNYRPQYAAAAGSKKDRSTAASTSTSIFAKTEATARTTYNSLPKASGPETPLTEGLIKR